MKYKVEQVNIEKLRNDLMEKIAPLVVKEEKNRYNPFLSNIRLDLDFAIAYNGIPEKVMEIAYRYGISIEDYLIK